MLDQLSSAPLLWQKEAYDNMLESAHQVSSRVHRRVQQLADRFPDVPWGKVPPPEPFHDLRTAPRTAEHMALQLWIPDILEVILDTVAIDQSVGGLGLYSPFPLDPGTLLYARPDATDDETTWVPLEVRHCEPDDRGWIIGCRFTSPDQVLEETLQ